MKIVILEPLGISEMQAVALKNQIVADGGELIYYNTPALHDEEKIARAQGAEVVMLANTPFRQNVLEKCPDLKLLSVAFTGVDHVDVTYCQAKGVTVCNCSGYANEAVSELVIGLVIALYRQLMASDSAVRNGKNRVGLLGRELRGKKFGIVGAGAIGLQTAALARAFGCDVYAYSRTPKTVSGVHFVALDELLAQSDIVSIHVPLTAATKGLIGAVNLAKMKKTAVLINTARGPVVDSAALAAALAGGQIAGAAVDVFENEPPIAADHVLLQAPHVLLTPHIGFATQEALEKRAVIAFENIRSWLAGKPQNVM